MFSKGDLTMVFCSLDHDLPCPCRDYDKCSASKESCTFAVLDNDMEKESCLPDGYVRQERWYEKYYNNEKDHIL